MTRLNPTHLILLSFATIILFGMVLLLLPFSGRNTPLSFTEALFTATSATCVTGLTVIDIGTRLTHFGQLVVLLLIQLGGLGIMTFSTFFIFLISKRFSLRNREILQQTLTQYPMKDLGALLKSVFLVTILIELAGATLYWFRFAHDYSNGRAGFLAIFHSVSAFCNAGFSLFSDSFIRYQGDISLNLITIALIVIGGLGFIVLHDLYRNWRWKYFWKTMRFGFHTRVVIVTSFVLILSGALLLFLFESADSSLQLPLPTRVLTSLFQSVTSRTAGFNTMEIRLASNASLLLIILLMIIGASPASCGGGIKTSTFAITLAMISSRIRNREEVHLFRRRVPQTIVSKAVVIVFFSILIIFLFTLLLLVVESGNTSQIQGRGSFLEIFFEVVSAYGTVGLSTGITGNFSTTGRILLILLMYIGRLGPLTLAMAISGNQTERVSYRYPEETLLVG